MPDILPIRAWRYNAEISRKIDEITSPLFDVVTEKQLERLYSNPYSSIHLSVPRGENASTSAVEILADWKNNGIILQDQIPGIYVYYQHYSLPGSVTEITRKGFIANLKLSEWEEKKLLRHERTIPNQVNTRIELLDKTELNVSPTHGFYTDKEKSLEEYMDEAIRYPILETEDYQGVRDVLAVIQDWKIIKKFIDVVGERPVILADGHHRYEASLDYWRRKRKEPDHDEKKGYNFHMMYFTNTESENIRIMATHRLISGFENMEEKGVLEKLENSFTIKKIDDVFALPEVILGKKWTFGLLFKENAYKVRLRDEAMEQMYKRPNKSHVLDVSIAHKFIIDQVMGIPLEKQSQSNQIQYDRNFSDCYAKILKGESQLAIVMNEINLETVIDVCYSGLTLPQKTTFFYPKVISGFLYSSLKDDEFTFPLDLSF